MSFLSLHNLTVSYDKTPVLHDFNLEIRAGDIYCLLGKSGCGKSTLLKTICGIVKPISGEILIENQPINPVQHTIGYIPQNYGLLNWLTIKENIFLGKKIRKMPFTTEDEQIISQLEISNLLNRYPKELSGGQQQRAALARAWLLQPDLLLMDEPFSALDSFTAERSIEVFLQLWQTQHITTLFVTHNIRETEQIGTHIVNFSDLC